MTTHVNITSTTVWMNSLFLPRAHNSNLTLASAAGTSSTSIRKSKEFSDPNHTGCIESLMCARVMKQNPMQPVRTTSCTSWKKVSHMTHIDHHGKSRSPPAQCVWPFLGNQVLQYDLMIECCWSLLSDGQSSPELISASPCHLGFASPYPSQSLPEFLAA